MLKTVLVRRALICALMLTGPQATAARAPSQEVAAQPPPVKASLNNLNNLLERVPGTPATLRVARVRAGTALSKLIQLSARWPDESPLDYRTNLATSVTVFSRALDAYNVVRLGAVLESLGDDLEVKLDHCTRNGGALGGSVVVSVRTVRGGQESRNWQVFYLPKLFEDAGGVTPDRFPKLSSPTSETLVPGRYVIWVREANGSRTSERVTVRVGEGKKDLMLDLSVPAAR